MVSYCDRCISVVSRAFKGHLLLNYWLVFTKLGRNDPYMALLIIVQIVVKIDFQDENFKNLLV